jgi:outer membrane protein assembly factor BamB
MVNPVEKGLPDSWSVKEGQTQNVKWAAALGSVSYGGPVVADGRVLVGTNNEKPRDPKVKGDRGVVMCFKEDDGSFLWQVTHDKLGDQDRDWPQQGVASTPVIDGGRAYYVSNKGELVCVDVLTEKPEGRVAWKLDMVEDLKVHPRYLANCSPLVVGDLVFTLTGNGIDDTNKVPSPDAPDFLAVDKKTGKVVWKDSSPGKNIMEGQWSNPAFAEVNGKGQVIFPGGDGWLYSFEAASGKPVWKFDCNPKDAVYKPGGRGDRSYLMATPVVHNNKLYVGIGQNPDNGPGVGHLWCVDVTKTGDLTPADPTDPAAAANKNSGLIWHFGGAVKPRPASGRDYLFSRTLSTCAIADGLLYVADLEGFLYCLDAKTGAKHWDADLKAAIWGSPYVVDGKVYVGNDDGDLFIFAHDKVAKQLAKIEMEHPIKSTPVAVNGVLYILTDTHLFALAKK